MRAVISLLVCAALSGCMTTRPTSIVLPWEQRMDQLQHAVPWQLEGRVAVALGAQGWQASLNWFESGYESEVHLAGPLGVGAQTVTRTAAGLSLNGAPPSDAVVLQLEDKLGFDLPLAMLRYWLLGIPDPDMPAQLVRNAQDRAQQLTQSGWTIDYDRYLSVGHDVLPGHVVLAREGVRVRVAIDHWTPPR